MDTLYTLSTLLLDHSPQVSIVIPPTTAMEELPDKVGIEARYINLNGGKTFVVRYEVSLQGLTSPENGRSLLQEFRESANYLVSEELKDRRKPKS